MTTHFENINDGINRALAPLEPYQELHECVTRTAETVDNTSDYLKDLRGSIADLGDKAVELVGVVFPKAAVAANSEATDVIERSYHSLCGTLRSTNNSLAIEGLQCINAARAASYAVNENLKVGGQELADQISVKLGELLALMDVVADQGLKTTVLDRGSLLRMAENEAAPPFQDVAAPLTRGVTLLRQFQQSIS